VECTAIDFSQSEAEVDAQLKKQNLLTNTITLNSINIINPEKV
jgi:hypothetical protein